MDDPQDLAAVSLPAIDPAPAPPPVRPTATHRIFIGRFGLRAGWGIALYVFFLLFAFAVLVVSIMAMQGKLMPAIEHHRQVALARKNHTPPPPEKAPAPEGDMKFKSSFVTEVLEFIPIVLASWLLSKIERRRFSVYGIGRHRLRDVVPGAFWGFASLSLLVGLLRAFHLLVFDGRALHGAPILIFAFKWLLVFIFVGLFEEYLLRGYLQYSFTRGFIGLAERISPTHARAIAFWMAAFVMSLLFASGHLANPGEDPMGLVMVFVAGIVFSYALWQTGTLWWAIGFHLAWDWSQSFLYGVPDSGYLSAGRLFNTHPVGNVLLSGGHDGPEGSVLVIPVLLLVLFVISRTRRGEQPPLEPLSREHSSSPTRFTVSLDPSQPRESFS